MPRQDQGKSPAGSESWPVSWRIVLVESDGEASLIDEVECEAFARQRAEELRDFGWPVRLERVAREPLPDNGLSSDLARRHLRDLKRDTNS
jgi:hypothetical protein